MQVMQGLCIRQESVRLEEFLEREITIIVQILPRQPADKNTPKDKKPMQRIVSCCHTLHLPFNCQTQVDSNTYVCTD